MKNVEHVKTKVENNYWNADNLHEEQVESLLYRLELSLMSQQIRKMVIQMAASMVMAVIVNVVLSLSILLHIITLLILV